MGPMAAAAALSAATVAELAPVGGEAFVALTAGLAITAGAAALIAGLLRLGFLAEFISPPVLKGLIIGLALTIIVGQLPKLFGFRAGRGDLFEQAWHLVTHLGDTQGLALLVGTCSLAVIIGLRRLAPAVPGPLVAVVGAVAAVNAFGLDVPTVGSIASGLPSLGVPDVAVADFGRLAGGGIGVMLIAFAEGLGAAKAYRVATIGGSMPAVSWWRSAAPTSPPACRAAWWSAAACLQPAVNASAGARTQVSGLLAAGLTVVALLFLTGLLEDLPAATLAAVVIAAVIELVDVPALVELYDTYTRRLGRQFGGSRARLHRRGGRPARSDSLRDPAGAVLRDRRLAAAARLPGLRPYVAVLGRTPGPESAYRDIAIHDDARPPDGIVVLRSSAACISRTPDGPLPHRRRRRRRACARRDRRCRDDPVRRRHRGPRARRHARGAATARRAPGARPRRRQVRDVLGCVSDDPDLTAPYPTIKAAIAALDGAKAT